MGRYSDHYNPYRAGKPLTSDEGFFGRDDIIEKVRMILDSRQNNLVVLYGQRRIGKTSILHKLERSLPNPPYFAINFDLQDKAHLPLNEVLYAIAAECAKKAGLQFDSMEEFVSDTDAFHETFLPLLYKNLDKEKKLVLLFDEFDVLDQSQKKLPDTAAANAFHPYLRKLLGMHPDLCFVFVVGRRMEELGYEYLSTFKSSHNILVFVLAEKDAIELIRRGERDGIAYEEDAIQEILFVTRGHPYFIQLICQELFNKNIPDQNNGKLIITKNMVQEAIPAAIKNGSSAFYWIWHGLPPAERIIFSVIAEGAQTGQVLTENDIANILQDAGVRMLVRELNIAPVKLVEWNMLEKIGNGYRFYFEILRRWVEENKKLEKVWEELEKINPLAEGLYDVANKYYLDNNYDSSLSRLDEALNLNPNHYKARLLKGKILYERNEYELAIGELKQAFALDEKEALYPLIKAMLEYGALLESQEREEDAENIYNEIIQDIYEHEEEALARRTAILVRRGDFFKSKGDLVQAHLLYLDAGASQKAADLINKLEAQAHDYVSTYKWDAAKKIYSVLREIQPEKGEWEIKEIEISELIKIEKNIDSKVEGASRQFRNGDYEESLETLDEAVRFLGKVKINHGRPYDVNYLKNRIKELRQSVSNSKSNIEQAKITLRSGDFNKTQLIINKELEGNSSNQIASEVLDTTNRAIKLLGEAKREYNNGNLESAQQAIDSAIQISPDSPDAKSLKELIISTKVQLKDAENAYNAKDYLLAKTNLERVLRAQPSNAAALRLTRIVDQRINKVVDRKRSTRWTLVLVGIISSIATLVLTITFVPLIGNVFLSPTPSVTSEIHNTPAIAEDTPVASVQPIRFFDSNRFIPLPLGETHLFDGTPASAKTATENLQLPPGYHVLNGIPLEFRYEIFTQHEGAVDAPTQLVIPSGAQGPIALYFLIQADYGFSRYAGRQLGIITAYFENGQTYEYPLVMGLNVRDWTRGDVSFAVTEVTSPDIIYEWHGTAPNGRAGGMDLLKISIPEELRSQKISSIHIVDTSLETAGDINVGIRILAASIEIEDQTQAPWEYQVEQIPASDTSLEWSLRPNEVFILTGGSFSYQGNVCRGGGTQICVLVIKATKDSIVFIENLVPKNNWIAISTTISPEEAVSEVADEFWITPNCGEGCSSGRIEIYIDEALENTYELQNPNQ
jgi:tetratricopeptide (TPR) repeat protein